MQKQRHTGVWVVVDVDVVVTDVVVRDADVVVSVWRSNVQKHGGRVRSNLALALAMFVFRVRGCGGSAKGRETPRRIANRSALV